MTGRPVQGPGATPRRPWRSRVRQLVKRARRAAIYGVACVVVPLTHLIPEEVALAAGPWLGEVLFRFARTERDLALEHLRLAYGESLSEAERVDLCRRMFRHMGLLAGEMTLLTRRPPATPWSRIEYRKFEHDVRAGLARGRGLVFLTGHISNWEMGGQVLARACRPHPPVVVARRIYYGPFDRAVTDLRRRLGMRVHYRDDSPRALIRHLRRGGAVAILVDQDVSDVPGVFVDFFGRPAYSMTGPISLALHTGATVIIAFLTREGRGYRLNSLPFEVERTGDRREDVRRNTQRWSERLEAEIRKVPEQWPWHHRRWKTTEDVLERRGRKRRSTRRRRG